LCGALARSYAEGARGAGCETTLIDVSILAFDPDVRSANPGRQALEPDLAAARAALDAAQHLVFVYPTWWGVYPARLKGFIDRLFTAGWAFADIEGGARYDGLLKGKTAELITTMDTPDVVYRRIYGAPGHRALARATLGFCGIEVTRVTRFGIVRDADAQTRFGWLTQARALGARLAHGPRGAWARAKAAVAPWLAALRLQFYPMTFLAYWVGALMAARAAGLDLAAFWLGYAVLFALEAATVFANDVYDFDSDRRNRLWSLFTGGSRVLVTGALSPRALLRGVRTAFGAAVALGLALIATSAQPLTIAVFLSLFAVLALGYTVPPLKLSHRALGEGDVALTHSFGALLFGFAAQGGALSLAAPWLVALPLFFAVLPAIILSGAPDHDADLAAGKRTLAVRFGVAGAARIAAVSAVVAAALAFALPLVFDAPELAGLAFVGALHAIWLVARIRRDLAGATGARRIDGLMAVALSYIVWFGLIPLVNLLRG
jgi:putative NADPH-quinone reductase/1,4-dihydroxy-2-naphthoate octaprenyltransferase